jgi:hypothetical protein
LLLLDWVQLQMQLWSSGALSANGYSPAGSFLSRSKASEYAIVNELREIGAGPICRQK